VTASAANAADRRPYDDGPLTADDFRADPPANLPAKAHTGTELIHEYRYRYVATEASTTVTLTSFKVTAYIERDRSWNAEPENAALLDHEQGHADAAQIECLRTRAQFRQLVLGAKPLATTAPTLKEAVAALEKKIASLMAAHEQAVRDADAAYDKATEHGLGQGQAEWRRVQKATLRQLEERSK
jgi:hypothetical protein